MWQFCLSKGILFVPLLAKLLIKDEKYDSKEIFVTRKGYSDGVV